MKLSSLQELHLTCVFPAWGALEYESHTMTATAGR